MGLGFGVFLQHPLHVYCVFVGLITIHSSFFWILTDLITIPSLCLLSTCWFNCIILVVYVQYPHHICWLIYNTLTVYKWIFCFFTNVQIHLIRRYFCKGWSGFTYKWSWRSNTTSCHARCNLGAWRVKVGVQIQWMTNTYVIKWLFCSHLDKKHKLQMEVGKSGRPSTHVGGQGNKTTMPWIVRFWTSHKHGKHKMKRKQLIKLKKLEAIWD